MLKNVPPILSPELLKTLAEMGHGDELVIADGNFPASALARRLVRADGHNVPAVLDAILEFCPLDTYVEQPVALMDNGDPQNPPPVWERLRYIVERHEGEQPFELVNRFDFYDRAKRAFAVVATSETALYANVIIKKGVLGS